MNEIVRQEIIRALGKKCKADKQKKKINTTIKDKQKH